MKKPYLIAVIVLPMIGCAGLFVGALQYHDLSAFLGEVQHKDDDSAAESGGFLALAGKRVSAARPNAINDWKLQYLTSYKPLPAEMLVDNSGRILADFFQNHFWQHGKKPHGSVANHHAAGGFAKSGHAQLLPLGVEPPGSAPGGGSAAPSASPSSSGGTPSPNPGDSTDPGDDTPDLPVTDVPDNGCTMAMLGLACAGLAGLRWRYGKEISNIA